MNSRETISSRNPAFEFNDLCLTIPEHGTPRDIYIYIICFGITLWRASRSFRENFHEIYHENYTKYMTVFSLRIFKYFEEAAGVFGHWIRIRLASECVRKVDKNFSTPAFACHSFNCSTATRVYSVIRSRVLIIVALLCLHNSLMSTIYNFGCTVVLARIYKSDYMRHENSKRVGAICQHNVN